MRPIFFDDTGMCVCVYNIYPAHTHIFIYTRARAREREEREYEARGGIKERAGGMGGRERDRGRFNGV